MIKLKKEKRADYERDQYDAKVEEALAKWEAAKPPKPSQETKTPRPRKS